MIFVVTFGEDFEWMIGVEKENIEACSLSTSLNSLDKDVDRIRRGERERERERSLRISLRLIAYLMSKLSYIDF